MGAIAPGSRHVRPGAGRFVALWRSRVARAAFVAVAAAAICSPSALADGDPASDVLATQSLFLPADAGLSLARQEQLVSLVDAARARGLSLRVAMIASPNDLGSVTELWRQPGLYSRFLGQELSLLYRGAVLVVMPNGFGLYARGGVAPAAKAALAGLAPPGSTAKLGDAALTAIDHFAAASGHPLPAPSAVRTPTAGTGSGDPVAWIVFAAGLIAIVVAWTLSLRARPLQATSRNGRTWYGRGTARA